MDSVLKGGWELLSDPLRVAGSARYGDKRLTVEWDILVGGDCS